MEAELWIPAAFGLFGTILGSGISYLGVRGQLKQAEKLDSERRREEAEREQKRQARAAAERAAPRCETLLTRLRDDIPALHSSHRSNQFNRELSDRVRSTFDQLSAEVAYLPPATRANLRTAVELLQWADDFGGDGPYGTHYHGVYTIVHRVTDWARSCLAAFLNNEHAEPFDEYVVEYQAALAEMYEDKEDEFAPDIAQSQERRAAWLAKHPEIATQLRRRGSSLPPSED